MFTTTDKIVVSILSAALFFLLVNAYQRDKDICEKHFPDEVHECLWSSKYRVTPNG